MFRHAGHRHQHQGADQFDGLEFRGGGRVRCRSRRRVGRGGRRAELQRHGLTLVAAQAGDGIRQRHVQRVGIVNFLDRRAGRHPGRRRRTVGQDVQYARALVPDFQLHADAVKHARILLAAAGGFRRGEQLRAGINGLADGQAQAPVQFGRLKQRALFFQQLEEGGDFRGDFLWFGRRGVRAHPASQAGGQQDQEHRQCAGFHFCTSMPFCTRWSAAATLAASFCL